MHKFTLILVFFVQFLKLNASICNELGYIKSELLFLKPFQDGLQCNCRPVEIVDVETVEGIIDSTIKENDRDPKYNWDFGFRLGGGYFVPCSNWQVEAFYTHFDSTANIIKNPDGWLKWKLNLNILDLSAKYLFHVHCFDIGVYTSLRFADIDQKTHFESVTSVKRITAADGQESTTLQIRNKKARQQSPMIGPLLGTSIVWKACENFGFCADISIGSLYGRFKIKEKSIDNYSNANYLTRKKRPFSCCQAVVDSTLGAYITTKVCKFNVAFFLGWEQHRYFNFNAINTGDFCFDGINFSATVHF